MHFGMIINWTNRFVLLLAPLSIWSPLWSANAIAQDATPDAQSVEVVAAQSALLGNWAGIQEIHGNNQACQTCHKSSVANPGIHQIITMVDENRRDLSFAYSPIGEVRLALETPAVDKFLRLGEYLTKKLDDAVLRKHLKLEDRSAYVIQSETDNDQQTLKYGDVILRIENINLDNVSTLPTDMEKLKEDAQLELEIIRDGEPLTLSVAARELQKPKGPYQVGVILGDVPEALRAHVDLSEGVGVLVNQVVVNSPAAKAGVAVHDILLTADGNGLASLADLRDTVQASKGSEVEFEILRAGKQITQSIAPKRAAAGAVSLTVPGCPGLKQTGGVIQANPLVDPSSEYYHLHYDQRFQGLQDQ